MEDRFLSAIGVETLSIGVSVGYLYAVVSESWDRFEADGVHGDVRIGLYQSCKTTILVTESMGLVSESTTCKSPPLKDFKYHDIALPEDTVTPIVAILMPICLVFSILTTATWSLLMYYMFKRKPKKITTAGFASVFTALCACILGLISSGAYIEFKKGQRAKFLLESLDHATEHSQNKDAADEKQLEWNIGPAPILVIICSVLSFGFTLAVSVAIIIHEKARKAEQKRKDALEEAGNVKAVEPQRARSTPRPRGDVDQYGNPKYERNHRNESIWGNHQALVDGAASNRGNRRGDPPPPAYAPAYAAYY